MIRDFKTGETTLPLAFQVVKPKSKVPLFIAAGFFALIALIALMKDIARKSKQPVLKLVLEKREENGFESFPLMRIKPDQIKLNKYKISVGPSPTCIDRIDR